MITLTYPREYSKDGQTVRKNRDNFLRFCRREFGNPDYLWFLEFQRRGAPHIHLLLDWPMPVGRLACKAVRFRVSARGIGLWAAVTRDTWALDAEPNGCAPLGEVPVMLSSMLAK